MSASDDRFFLENLCRVRHTTVVASKIEDPGDLPRPELKPVSGTCASVRLDSLIALAFGTSRSSIVHCIEEGLVFVNGKLITSNGYEPKEGDIISVRKKGRFIYDGVSRQTKKDVLEYGFCFISEQLGGKRNDSIKITCKTRR